MAMIVGQMVNSGAYQKLKAAYDNAEKFIEISAAKNRAIKAMGDGLKNVEVIPLLLSETKFGSGPSKFSDTT
ncbi:hypothetical protein N9E48_03510 [Paracoccaceae bacterium]|nr:hypothetical protein [Paracoccaceae bacterium]